MTKLSGHIHARAAPAPCEHRRVFHRLRHLPMHHHRGQVARASQAQSQRPCADIEDDGAVVWESMAINLYLAEKYGKNSLWPSNPAARADIYKWSFFAMTEVEPHLITLLVNRVMAPPNQRNEKAALAAIESLKARLNALEESLKGKEYILGKNFTIADLNVAAVMSWIPMMKLDLSSTPNVQAWLQKCLGREANKKVRGLK